MIPIKTDFQFIAKSNADSITGSNTDLFSYYQLGYYLTMSQLPIWSTEFKNDKLVTNNQHNQLTNSKINTLIINSNYKSNSE